jgi:RNA polymerase sigma-70 factor (ECF subfamily)
VETSQANARQLVQRAKRHLSEGRPRFASDATQADELARRFMSACREGDLDTLLTLLAEDAVAWSDGGGQFAAARRPVLGADRVARFVASVVAKWTASGDVLLAPVSGGLGLVLHVGGQVRAVMTIAAREAAQRVHGVFIVVNPERLGRSGSGHHSGPGDEGCSRPRPAPS